VAAPPRTPKRIRIECRFGSKYRSITLTPGERYRVEPMNIRKVKDRGRSCVYLKLAPTGALVKFLDTGRTGVVDTADLISEDTPVGKSLPGYLEETLINSSWNKSQPLARVDTSLTGNEWLRYFPPMLHMTAEFLDRPDVVRWARPEALPTSEFWGSKRNAANYQLIVKAYSSDGVPRSLYAFRTAQRAPTGASLSKWPARSNHRDLLMANASGLRLLRGQEKSRMLVMLTDGIEEFLLTAAYCHAQEVTFAVIALPTGASPQVLAKVRWPATTAFIVGASRVDDLPNRVRSVEKILGSKWCVIPVPEFPRAPTGQVN